MKYIHVLKPPITVAASDSKFASYFKHDCLLFLGKNFLNQKKIELQHIHVLSLNKKAKI